MPLIFGTEAPTLWTSDYADITGVQYEFPERYQAYVQPGDRFIYYRGSRSGAAGYFGDGVVGDIKHSAKPAHLIAEVNDVVLYDELVALKDSAGNYYETGSTKGTNWANGVRRISDGAFERITGFAVPIDSTDTNVAAGWASPEHTRLMERYAVEVAMQLLADEFGGPAVTEMPPGNPGYDIEVTMSDGPLHVEVKGTILSAPAFHLSEGQRAHAALMGERFRLIVVYAISLASSTHEVASCSGTDLPTCVTLRPAAWSGVLRVSPS